MPLVYLGLGSNIENRFLYIKKALIKINEIKGNKIIFCSSLYETEPWGIKEQNYFLNCAAKIETALAPDELLIEIKKIESELGRESRAKWKEREIDIDILFYDELIINSDYLTIPHRGIADRKFVLVPLSEIEPDLRHPVYKKKIKEILVLTKDKSKVEKYNLQENEELIY